MTPIAGIPKNDIDKQDSLRAILILQNCLFVFILLLFFYTLLAF